MVGSIGKDELYCKTMLWPHRMADFIGDKEDRSCYFISATHFQSLIRPPQSHSQLWSLAWATGDCVANICHDPFHFCGMAIPTKNVITIHALTITALIYAANSNLSLCIISILFPTGNSGRHHQIAHCARYKRFLDLIVVSWCGIGFQFSASQAFVTY